MGMIKRCGTKYHHELSRDLSLQNSLVSLILMTWLFTSILHCFLDLCFCVYYLSISRSHFLSLSPSSSLSDCQSLFLSLSLYVSLSRSLSLSLSLPVPVLVSPVFLGFLCPTVSVISLGIFDCCWNIQNLMPSVHSKNREPRVSRKKLAEGQGYSSTSSLSVSFYLMWTSSLETIMGNFYNNSIKKTNVWVSVWWKTKNWT